MTRRRTKILATIGPASDSVETLVRLIQTGVNVFRLNMAHGDIDAHTRRVTAIREASKLAGLPVGILADLAGPKLRLGKLAGEELACDVGDRLTLRRGRVTEKPRELVTEYDALVDEISVGDRVVIGDGTIALEVESKSDDEAICRVVDGGTIRSRQGIALPNTRLSIQTIGPQDYAHADWAVQLGLDYVSLSFVRNADDLHQLRSHLHLAGSRAAIIAKIEKRESLDALDEIVRAADGVMIARGDLGLEVDIATTSVLQKRIIEICRRESRPVIVATQMLESMHNSKQPTRAEVADVSNAVLDGADACMLSGETAVGRYPVDTVRMMSRIIEEAEKLLPRTGLSPAIEASRAEDVTEAVLQGAAQISRVVGSSVVVIVTKSGRSAVLKSKLRDRTPTLCITDSRHVLGQACLWWGVMPLLIESIEQEHCIFQAIIDWNTRVGALASGDRVVVVSDRRAFPAGHDSILLYQIP